MTTLRTPMAESGVDRALERIRETALKLFEYCWKHDFAGFDPYDALNSPLFSFTRLLDNRYTRIAATQFMKRLPFNVRGLLSVSREVNPKAAALFLAAFVRLSRVGLLRNDDIVESMVGRLVSLRSPGNAYWCWGYSFPWQTRNNLVPRSAPNLVCTVFVASALLDAYELNRAPRCLTMAVGAGDYILNELYWSEGEVVAGFSYPIPGLKVRIDNANFLGSALLCRLYRLTGEKKYRGPALRAARYSAEKQEADGSWPYGERSVQRWIDNFHTGYNLCALRSICRYAETTEFEATIRNGFAFYRSHFFREDGAPRYYHDRTYPIDIHAVAQSIITLLQLRDIDEHNVDLALSVYRWAMDNMWDEKGYFYYQVYPFFKNKISYMRWSQAWMFLSLSTLIEELSVNTAKPLV